MMGRTHALTGWCAGSAAAGLLGYHQLEQAVLLAATTAGFALLPDLDHPQATPSRLLGSGRVVELLGCLGCPGSGRRVNLLPRGRVKVGRCRSRAQQTGHPSW